MSPSRQISVLPVKLSVCSFIKNMWDNAWRKRAQNQNPVTASTWLHLPRGNFREVRARPGPTKLAPIPFRSQNQRLPALPPRECYRTQYLNSAVYQDVTSYGPVESHRHFSRNSYPCLLPWMWGQNAPPKHFIISNRLNCLSFQNALLFILPTLITLNPTSCSI